MAHILAISLGPVQDFIAAARKTRDLWFGSSMLSDVSRAAAQSLQGRGELIFPPASCISSGSSVANKIVAVIEDGSPQTAAEDARTAALQVLEDCRNKALQELRHRGIGSTVAAELDARMKEHLEDFIEFYAAWWPLNGDYPEARLQADRLLAGRKALRDFQPARSRDGLPKSSLDGGRDSILDPASLTDRQRQSLGIKMGEFLDGISLMKRLAEPRRFVSVSRIAVDPLIRRLEQEDPAALKTLNDLARRLEPSDLTQSFKGFQQFKAFPYDTQLFYSDASAEKDADQDQKALAKEFYDSLRGACSKLRLGEPPAYFAVLAGDGDGMGALISRIRDREEHKGLSEALAGFAADADGIVQSNFGAVIYSGGDDVLAFLPLDTALKCADELRRAFSVRTTQFVRDGCVPSFSCGVSIAHYGENLQNLLQWGRMAERAAKRCEGKNALAVHLHTRTAGEEHAAAVHSWAADPVAARWDVWTKLLADEAVPAGAAYELRSLVREFRGASEKTCSAVLGLEVKRILKRKKAERGGRDISPDEVETLAGSFEGTLDGLDGLVNELIISRHLARVRKIVGR